MGGLYCLKPRLGGWVGVSGCGAVSPQLEIGFLCTMRTYLTCFI